VQIHLQVMAVLVLPHQLAVLLLHMLAVVVQV
jgi:hypothetical protein